ncbi:hypothetical protein OESDEN_06871 [Oesophagostomum dentatum]|uniref:Uncharacterized protein n=1 Tax=Oesophagostomum dentatum TaxID=61180 RepID=A0A0B1T6Q1_OESDE|nr:hypothetical protein OESDEN_06871 [Oesophagostomum dentatum]
MYFVFLLLQVLQALELPLAPYNVKVFCRQGRRYTRQAQTELQCSSSTTACGFFELSGPDEQKGLSKIGVYECVDSGILQTTIDDDLEGANNAKVETIYRREEKNLFQGLFAELCGAVPQCSSLNLDMLNPSFLKYLIVQHNVRLESLTSRRVRFCCSLFHHTLQKLVTSEKDRLPSVPAPPVHCQSEVCGAEAVGCLMHSLTSDSEEEYDESEDVKKTHRKAKRRVAKAQTDEDYDAVELFFDFDEDQDDSNIRFVTKPPSRTTTLRPIIRASVKKASANLRVATRKNKTVPTTTTVHPRLVEDEYEYHEDIEETHCVYRHLNDEMYRYCLLVHQKKDGDRCYYHEGHTICCCFVPPGRSLVHYIGFSQRNVRPDGNRHGPAAVAYENSGYSSHRWACICSQK